MLAEPPHSTRREAIVIGGSTGALEVLTALLANLRADFETPILIVVHLPPRKPSLLVSLFAPRCAVRVAEPLDKEPIGPGVWFAPAGYHLLVEKSRTFALSLDDAVHHSRPAIDVLFESAAECYRAALVGLVLTGASRDGSHGVRAIKERGGRAYAQEPSSAAMSAMPASAVEAGATAATIDECRLVLHAPETRAS
jgi:two-component system chemotaxis response regulator CheB